MLQSRQAYQQVFRAAQGKSMKSKHWLPANMFTFVRKGHHQMTDPQMTVGKAGWNDFGYSFSPCMAGRPYQAFQPWTRPFQWMLASEMFQFQWLWVPKAVSHFTSKLHFCTLVTVQREYSISQKQVLIKSYSKKLQGKNIPILWGKNIPIVPVNSSFIYIESAVPDLETFTHCWWTKTPEENDVHYLPPLASPTELQMSLNLQCWMSTVLS